MNLVSKKILLASAAALACLSAQATVSIAAPGASYTQNFNALPTTGSMGNWTNDSTLQGWSMFTTGGAAEITYISSGASITTPRPRNIGTATDRALGARTANAYQDFTLALALTNTSGAALSGVNLRYDGEQWRHAAQDVPNVVVLSYGIGSTFASVTNWTTPGGSFDFTAPITGATASTPDGNVAGLVPNLGGNINLNWNAGDTLWVKWTFPSTTDAIGSDTLAIDNVTVTAVPEPASIAMLGLGLGVVALGARRRKRA